MTDDPVSAPRLQSLHVLAPAEAGGLESVVVDLTAGLQARGHRVTVLAVVEPEHRCGGLFDEIEMTGARLEILALGRRGYLAERSKVKELCDRLQPDVVHTHGYRPDVLDGAVGRGLGIATISTVHGFTSTSLRIRFYEWLQRRALRRYDAVIAVSGVLARQLEGSGVRRERIHVVPNATRTVRAPLSRGDARSELGISGDGHQIGWVGRISQEKGLDVLIDALSLLGDLPVQLSVIGDGADRALLEARATERQVGDRVIWHGSVHNAGAYFAAFDTFVLSSRTEGTPMALFEAIGSRVPVVATRVGGVPDVVSENEAYLVGPDDPAALAGAIRATLEQRREARQRAARALERVRSENNAEDWITNHERIYQSVVEANGT